MTSVNNTCCEVSGMTPQLASVIAIDSDCATGFCLCGNADKDIEYLTQPEVRCTRDVDCCVSTDPLYSAKVSLSLLA